MITRKCFFKDPDPKDLTNEIEDMLEENELGNYLNFFLCKIFIKYKIRRNIAISKIEVQNRFRRIP